MRPLFRFVLRIMPFDLILQYFILICKFSHSSSIFSRGKYFNLLLELASLVLIWQYFLPFAAEGINNHIEEAILRADRLGVKVISLAALNKASFLTV